VQPFLKPQAAGINGSQISVIVKCADTFKDVIHFCAAKDAWKASFFFRFENIEKIPLPTYDVLKEKSDAAITDFHSIRCLFAFVSAKKKIIAEFLFGDQVRFLADMLNQHPNGPCITLLRASAFSINLLF